MRFFAAFLVAAFALSLLPGTAAAAPGDPWVAYVANSVVTKQSAAAPVILRADPSTGGLTEISRNGAQGDHFRHPYDIAVAADGSLLVADMGAFATRPTVRPTAASSASTRSRGGSRSSPRATCSWTRPASRSRRTG